MYREVTWHTIKLLAQEILLFNCVVRNRYDVKETSDAGAGGAIRLVSLETFLKIQTNGQCTKTDEQSACRSGRERQLAEVGELF